MQQYPLHILKQFLIESLHMSVMCNMLIGNGHLTTTNTCTYITHAIVIPYRLMLVIRISLTSLRGIPHDLILAFGIFTNQRTTATGSNHLVTVKAQHPELAERPQYLSLKTGAKTFGSIFHHWNSIPIGYLHDTCTVIGHAVQCHRNNSFWLFSSLGNAVLDGFFQQFRRHVPSFFLRIHKYRNSPQISDRMRRRTECEALYNHFVTLSHSASQQSQMYCRRTGRKCHHFLAFAYKTFQILFKSIHIRTERNHPVRIEGFFYIFLFNTLLAHMGKAKINSFIHKYICDYLMIKLRIPHIVGNKKKGNGFINPFQISE